MEIPVEKEKEEIEDSKKVTVDFRVEHEER
jgi:hypothetical protein